MKKKLLEKLFGTGTLGSLFGRKKEKGRKPLVIAVSGDPAFALVVQSIVANSVYIGENLLEFESSRGVKAAYDGRVFSDCREDTVCFPLGSFAYKAVKGLGVRPMAYPPTDYFRRPLRERDVYTGNRTIPVVEKNKEIILEKLGKGSGLEKLIEEEDFELYHDSETGVRKGRGFLGVDTSPIVAPHSDFEVIEKFYRLLPTPFDYSQIVESLEFSVPKSVSESFGRFFERPL